MNDYPEHLVFRESELFLQCDIEAGVFERVVNFDGPGSRHYENFHRPEIFGNGKGKRPQTQLAPAQLDSLALYLTVSLLGKRAPALGGSEGGAEALRRYPRREAKMVLRAIVLVAIAKL